MSDTENQVPETITHQPRSFGAVSVWLILIMLLIAVSFMGWKAVEFESHYQQSQGEAQDTLQQLRRQVPALQIQVDEMRAAVATLQGADRSDWLLAEAEYLLRIANQQAVLGRDGPAAATLLSSADNVLKELNNSSYLKNIARSKEIAAVRELIAKERDALLMQPNLDREGLYLRIETFIQQLDAMPVVDLKNKNQSIVATIDEAKPMSGVLPEATAEKVLQSLKGVLKQMGGYLRVQQHDEAVTALLTPDQQLYLKQNLRFMLEQAQIALLQRQQKIYINSLDKASQWISQYYFMDHGVKAALLETLQEFSQESVEDSLPDISGSLSAVQTLIRSRHLQD